MAKAGCHQGILVLLLLLLCLEVLLVAVVYIMGVAGDFPEALVDSKLTRRP